MAKKSASQTFPYKTGEQSYNRESGRKTLLLVAFFIILIVLFSSLALLFLGR